MDKAANMANAANTVWRIVFGDYDLAIDRRTLTFSLTDTKTGVVWAEGLPVGWVELADRETGERTRYRFGDAHLVSISEKAGPQGKRILFGLDLLGIPIDVYVICAQREIQWIVEVSRDSRTHTVEDFGLLPGVVSVPDDGASYLVVPRREGAMLFARDAPTDPKSLPIWDANSGVTMPFVGAVRCEGGDVRNAVASLALLTDSAYGRFVLHRTPDGSACLNTEYSRDPERRRLDIRLVVLPHENHVAVARAYRDKIIGEKNHVTLRKKIRDRPSVEKLIGAAFLLAPYADIALLPSVRQEFGDAAFFVVPLPWPADEPIALPLANVPLTEHLPFKAGIGLDKTEVASRWEEMDQRLEQFAHLREAHQIVGSLWGADWSAIAADYWLMPFDPDLKSAPYFGKPLPLYAIVYHDSVTAADIYRLPWTPRFLRCLLNLSLPCYGLSHETWAARQDEIRWTITILCPLHRLTFPAFLTQHRFLTADMSVEEAVYSDKTRIVINQSETDDWHDDTLHLPPLGFYVRHPQMEAHNALRIGGETFPTRAWRISQSRDGLPLEVSEDIVREVFAV